MATDAGVAKKKAKARKEKEHQLLEPDIANGQEGNSKFARALGSVDFHTREKGLQALTRWLTSKKEVQEADMRKIWKGLFYCFWHSDKAPVQLELATRLAAILPVLHNETAYLYFTVFIHTMRREWFGIDRLRLDKFLMLIRKFLTQLLVYLKEKKWAASKLSQYVNFLHHSVLQPSDNLPAVGLAYHLADILLPELAEASGGEPLPNSLLQALLAPFLDTMRVCELPMLHRLREAVFDPILEAVRDPPSASRQQQQQQDSDGDDEGEDSAAHPSAYLAQLDVQALASAAFDAGAQPDVRARNRQELYGLSDALEKALRKRARREEEQLREQARTVSSKPSASSAAPLAAAEAAPATETAAANGKKKKKQKLAHQQAERQQQDADMLAAGGASAASGTSQQVEAAKASTSGKGKGSAAAASTPSGGGKHRQAEPTSGQKAALRASIKAFAQNPDAVAAQQSGREASHAGAGPRAVDAGGVGNTGKQVLGKRAHGAQEVSPSAPSQQHQQQQQAQGQPAVRKAQTAIKPSQKESVAAGPSSAQHAGTKPRVTINLKKNLYFEFNGPLPDPELRTPPSSRKGGILKRKEEASSTHGKGACDHGKHDQAKHKQSHATPVGRLPRASAAQFF